MFSENGRPDGKIVRKDDFNYPEGYNSSAKHFARDEPAPFFSS